MKMDQSPTLERVKATNVLSNMISPMTNTSILTVTNINTNTASCPTVVFPYQPFSTTSGLIKRYTHIYGSPIYCMIFYMQCFLCNLPFNLNDTIFYPFIYIHTHTQRKHYICTAIENCQLLRAEIKHLVKLEFS